MKKEFIKYQHIERFGTDETENIEIGTCYIFPKIDGTNASVWLSNGVVNAGSRKRHLSLDADNQGFLSHIIKDNDIKAYLNENPTHRLFGEFLIPHSLKTYRKDAWGIFYVFDVAIDKTEDEILHDGDDHLNYLHYETYMPILEAHNINYIPAIKIVENAGYDNFIGQLESNNFLIEDGKGSGEGIVIKNYEYKNKYNRQTWAKIVRSEFKDLHRKEMGAPTVKYADGIEVEIVEKYCTSEIIEKRYASISSLENGWNNKLIPRLLSTVYHDMITEETWHFLKDFNNPTINFSKLKFMVIKKIKETKPDLFK